MSVFSIEQPIKKYFSLPSTGDVSYFVPSLRHKCFFPSYSLIVSQAGETAEEMLLENYNKILQKGSSAKQHWSLQALSIFWELALATGNWQYYVTAWNVQGNSRPADLHPTTTMRLFVPSFPSKIPSRPNQLLGREKTCHTGVLFFFLLVF